MAAMSSAEGPLGPGLRRCDEEEKSRRYLRSTKAWWNLNSVAGLMSAPSFAIRRGLTNSVVRPSKKRSIDFRFGARCRERLLMSNWCFSSRDSAATARTPPGRTSFANVISRWMASMRSSRMERTVSSPPVRARLHGRGWNTSHYEFATHTTDSAMRLRNESPMSYWSSSGFGYRRGLSESNRSDRLESRGTISDGRRF
jgi:hypothetical protein